MLVDPERQGCCAYESVASTLEKCSSDLRSSFRISAAVSGVFIMSLKCPMCGAEGAAGMNNRRSIFSPTQRVRKQVVVLTVNVNQNCCNKCSPDYYLAEPDKCSETVRQQPSNQAHPPPPPPPAQMPQRPPPSPTDPSPVFAREVSDDEFRRHWLACKNCR